MLTQIQQNEFESQNLDRFSQAPEHLKDFWQAFFQELAHGIELMDLAWLNHDMKALLAHCHCYKGQVMLFRYQPLILLFDNIEHSIVSKHFETIQESLSDLKICYQEEVRQYEKYKNSHC